MVPIRSTLRTNNGHPVKDGRKIAFYAATIATFALTGIYLVSKSGSGSDISGGDAATSTSSDHLSPKTALNQLSAISGGSGIRSGSGSGGGSKNKEELDEKDVNPLSITQGSATYGGNDLPYFHCGPLPSADNPELTELVLLHGAAFTKEDWKKSGILDMLCDINNEEDEGNLSISALDLPVSADGKQLGMAFDALVSDRVLSGRAATFVSPSASGKALVSLGEMASNGSKELERIVKAWIPVAPPAVLRAADTTLVQYKLKSIPIMSIHGDQDGGGKRVTEKLQKLNDAEGVELEGRHPVYLDSPEEFVQEVMRFLDENGL